jgi:hypothetical protein
VGKDCWHHRVPNQVDIYLKSTGSIIQPIMDNAELDRLRQAYKNAVEKWISAIREEEALATPDHSVQSWDLWEKAGFAEEDARKYALDAKEPYESGLREADYGIMRTGL